MSGTLAVSHILPPLRVILIWPLFVPTQIIPGNIVDARMDSMAPVAVGAALGPPGVVRAPESGGDVRSALIAVQCAPPSIVVQTDWNAAMSICLSHGAK